MMTVQWLLMVSLSAMLTATHAKRNENDNTLPVDIPKNIANFCKSPMALKDWLDNNRDICNNSSMIVDRRYCNHTRTLWMRVCQPGDTKSDRNSNSCAELMVFKVLFGVVFALLLVLLVLGLVIALACRKKKQEQISSNNNNNNQQQNPNVTIRLVNESSSTGNNYSPNEYKFSQIQQNSDTSNYSHLGPTYEVIREQDRYNALNREVSSNQTSVAGQISLGTTEEYTGHHNDSAMNMHSTVSVKDKSVQNQGPKWGYSTLNTNFLIQPDHHEQAKKEREARNVSQQKATTEYKQITKKHPHAYCELEQVHEKKVQKVSVMSEFDGSDKDNQGFQTEPEFNNPSLAVPSQESLV